MTDDATRRAILRRRNHFIAAALASLGAAGMPGCGRCNPLVCLEPPPVDAGTPRAASSRGEAGVALRQTLVGVARHGKGGAAIVIDGEPVYVTGLSTWPAGWVGRRVEVTGDVRTRRGLPKPKPGEPPISGIVGPYRVIDHATWSLAEAAPSASARPAGSATVDPVGTVRMEADGTVVMTLYARGGMNAQLLTRHAKGDPEREEILKHVGGLQPGQEKLVPPWPDDIDDARVNAAVKAHVSSESWGASARITITGTDAQGRIAVTAVDPAPPRHGFALLLDPKTYAVVDAKPLNR